MFSNSQASAELFRKLKFSKENASLTFTENYKLMCVDHVSFCLPDHPLFVCMHISISVWLPIFLSNYLPTYLPLNMFSSKNVLYVLSLG